jgi:glycosyl transferase, family 25
VACNHYRCKVAVSKPRLKQSPACLCDQDYLVLAKQISIFIINLDRSPERLQRMSARLNLLGLTYERVSAIDGKVICEATREGFNPKRSWHIYSDSDIACYLSHLKVLSIIEEREIPRAIVLEDDAIFGSGFVLLADPAFPLPDEVELLKLEGFGAEKSPKIPISRCANGTIQFSYKPTGGAAAYIITLAGAKRVLRELKIMGGLLDSDLFAYWKTGIGVYELSPFPARQDGSVSTMTLPKLGSRTLRFRITRYIFKSYARFERAIYVLRKFGIRPLLAG